MIQLILFGFVLSTVDVLLALNQAHLEAIRTVGTVPPHASRNLAMMHQTISMSISELGTDCRDHSDGQVAAMVYGTKVLLEQFYPTQNFEHLVQHIGQSNTTCVQMGRMAGLNAGTGMLTQRAHDGSANQDSFVSDGAPGHWVPTPPAHQNPLLPNWGRVKPFGIKNVDTLTNLTTPPHLTSQEYLKAFNEVKELGSNNSVSRTADQTHIALF
jgi:hypothetical protein